MDKIAVSTKTQKEFNTLITAYENKGWKWADGEIPSFHKDKWVQYKINTAVTIEARFGMCNKQFLSENGYKIISLKEALKMLKKQYAVGDIVPKELLENLERLSGEKTAQELGFITGDLFILAGSNYSGNSAYGKVFRLERDDGTINPYFETECKSDRSCFYMSDLIPLSALQPTKPFKRSWEHKQEFISNDGTTVTKDNITIHICGADRKLSIADAKLLFSRFSSSLAIHKKNFETKNK